MIRITAVLVLYVSLVFDTSTFAQGIDVKLSDFRGIGSRVDWSPTGEFVVLDRKGNNGGFDLYLTRDFKNK